MFASEPPWRNRPGYRLEDDAIPVVGLLGTGPILFR